VDELRHGTDMDAVNDFKSIRSKLERREQKAEFEAKNPPPPAWYSKTVVWTPEGGYGVKPSA
jgi:hypothetical protein